MLAYCGVSADSAKGGVLVCVQARAKAATRTDSGCVKSTIDARHGRRYYDGLSRAVRCIAATGLANLRPHRLVAQDIGFSVREQGFDSPWGYLGKLRSLGKCDAPRRNSRGFLRLMRLVAVSCCPMAHHFFACVVRWRAKRIPSRIRYAMLGGSTFGQPRAEVRSSDRCRCAGVPPARTNPWVDFSDRLRVPID